MIIYSIVAYNYEYNDEYYYANSYSNIVNSFTELKDAENALKRINRELFEQVLSNGELHCYFDYGKVYRLTDDQEVRFLNLFNFKSFKDFFDNYTCSYKICPTKEIEFTQEQIDFLYDVCYIEFYSIQESELLNIFS